MCIRTFTSNTVVDFLIRGNLYYDPILCKRSDWGYRLIPTVCNVDNRFNYTGR